MEGWSGRALCMAGAGERRGLFGSPQIAQGQQLGAGVFVLGREHGVVILSLDWFTGISTC